MHRRLLGPGAPAVTAVGYGGMHLSDSNTVDGKTLKISPTLHGPIFGFGIFF